MAGGFQQIERAGRIPRKVLSHYTHNGTGGGNVYSSSVPAPAATIPVVAAGEELPQGYVVAIADDGLLYIASPLFANSLIGALIVSRTYAEGELVAVAQPGRITVPGASFTPGAPLWLRAGTPNVSETPLTEKSEDEDIIQRVGVALTATDVLVGIEAPLIFE